MNDRPDNRQKESLAPEYFDKIYRANPDPWNFARSEYEAEKYRTTVNALPAQSYDAAFEIGCSIGVLTEQLAARAKTLLSIDVSEVALAQAVERCRHLPHVKFELRRIPDDFPGENFDLIVVSEVGYYLSEDDWRIAAEKIAAQVNRGGSVVLVHWIEFVADYPQTGDQVHDRFSAQTVSNLQHVFNLRREKYRLDVWTKK